MIRIVERMDDEVRGAGMARGLLEYLQGDGSRQRLTPKPFVRGPHGAEQRDRIENCDLPIVRPPLVHPRHGFAVCVVPRQLVSWCVEEPVYRFLISLLRLRIRLREAAFARGLQALQRLPGRRQVDLRPQRMVITHGFAPVRQREVRIDLLRLMEGRRRLVELEAVQVLDSLNKLRLRSRRAGSRKIDAPKFLRLETRCDQHHARRHQGASAWLQFRHLAPFAGTTSHLLGVIHYAAIRRAFRRGIWPARLDSGANSEVQSELAGILQIRGGQMALKTGTKRIGAPAIGRPRKAKFQADLASAEDRAVRLLKEELQIASNTDFLSDAVALFRWAVSERKLGHRIVSESAGGERKILLFPRLERVAPDLALPRVEIKWTKRELESLAELASAREADGPTDALIRAMRA